MLIRPPARASRRTRTPTVPVFQRDAPQSHRCHHIHRIRRRRCLQRLDATRRSRPTALHQAPCPRASHTRAGARTRLHEGTHHRTHQCRHHRRTRFTPPQHNVDPSRKPTTHTRGGDTLQRARRLAAFAPRDPRNELAQLASPSSRAVLCPLHEFFSPALLYERSVCCYVNASQSRCSAVSSCHSAVCLPAQAIQFVNFGAYVTVDI